MAWTRRTLLAAPLVVPALTAGCSSATKPSTKDHVRIMTGFGSYGREAYPWVGDVKGMFAAHNLTATILPGAAGESNLTRLRAGIADMAVLDYAFALIHAGNQRLGDVRLVAAINPQTQIALMTLPGRGIALPADLAGRIIAQAPGATPRTLFPAYARLAGFDPGAVRWLEPPIQSLPAILAANRADAIGQYATGAPTIRAAAGVDPIILPYRTYIGDLYGNVLAVTGQFLRARPDTVRRTVAALMDGLRYTVDNPLEAGQIMHRAVPTTSAIVATAEIELLRGYVLPHRDGMGTFDPSRVARGIALLQSLGLYPNGFSPDSVVAFGEA